MDVLAPLCLYGHLEPAPKHGRESLRFVFPRPLQLLQADGTLVAVSETAGSEDEHFSKNFDGSVVNLGALGIITALQLKVVPTYKVCFAASRCALLSQQQRELRYSLGAQRSTGDGAC